MTSRTKEISVEERSKLVPIPWNCGKAQEMQIPRTQEERAGLKAEREGLFKSVHKITESSFFSPSLPPRPEVGSLFSKETEPKRFSTEGNKLGGNQVGREPRGKWRNGVKKYGTNQKTICKVVEFLYTSPTHSQNPGRQLNFALEILKKEPQN